MEWTRQSVLTEGSSDLCLLQKYNFSQANIRKPCDHNLFLTLLPKISSFKETAPYFGFTQPEIEEISIDKPTEKLRKLYMFWKWKSRNGSDATYLAIVNNFLSMSNKNLAEFVLQHIERCFQYKSQQVDTYVYPERSYGNWDEKSVGEKEQIKNRLFKENRDILFKFSSLTLNIVDSFEKSNVKVMRLKMFLYTFGNIPRPTKEALFSQFESATDLDDVFLIICRDYISWINIELLKAIVKKFGSKEDEMEMKEYEDELVSYLQRSIFEIPSKTFAPGHENAGLKSLFILLPDHVLPTGNDIIKIARNLSQLLDIPDGIPQFIGFQNCSMLLIFGVPKQLLQINAFQALIEKYFTFDMTKKSHIFSNDLDLIW